MQLRYKDVCFQKTHVLEQTDVYVIALLIVGSLEWYSSIFTSQRQRLCLLPVNTPTALEL